MVAAAIVLHTNSYLLVAANCENKQGVQLQPENKGSPIPENLFGDLEAFSISLKLLNLT